MTGCAMKLRGAALICAGKLRALALARHRAHEHAVAAGAVDRLHHQRPRFCQHVLELLRLAAAPRGHVRQDRVLLEVVADHVRHVGVDELVVGDARAGGIGQRHVALGPGAHEPRNAECRVRAERLRVEEIIVDAPIDHIHAPPAVDGLHVDAVVVGARQDRGPRPARSPSGARDRRARSRRSCRCRGSARRSRADRCGAATARPACRAAAAG